MYQALGVEEVGDEPGVWEIERRQVLPPGKVEVEVGVLLAADVQVNRHLFGCFGREGCLCVRRVQVPQEVPGELVQGDGRRSKMALVEFKCDSHQLLSTKVSMVSVSLVAGP